ncbi:serine/threonine-protein kinase ATR [Anopheles stephensi]|uniref:serine/threonine-protein kinase ATR n=1 Tax=Anopheles stephensi TaxID=30069 RepID=UPI001658A74D|nr:serine/threonine-protein kinase ATR [Anopheles stephensi]XP_035920017.1 serine/threonine-protein kinase ATR [Anopheles stephensi]
MPAMEATHEKRYSVEDTESMWKTLVVTFTDIVNDHGSHLEKILNMIRTDITYDDPGLFPRTLLTDAERERCRSFIYWLMYQLLRIASCEAYERISDIYTNLQREIVTACFVKQRWLALEITMEFIKLLDQMNDYQTDGSDTIRAFYHAFNNVTILGTAYKCETIAIDSIIRCRMIRKHCLHAITESMSLIINQQNEESSSIVNRSLCTVLRTFSLGNLQEKDVCITFFRVYFQQNDQALCSSYSLQQTLNVMSLLAVALNRISAWCSGRLVHQREVDRFLRSLTDLYTAMNTKRASLPLEQEWTHKISTVLIELLRSSKNCQTAEGIKINELQLHKLNHEMLMLREKLSPSLDTRFGFADMIICAEIMEFEEIMAKQIVKQIHNALSRTIDQNIRASRKTSVRLVSSMWDMLLEKVALNNHLLERALTVANKIVYKLSAQLKTSAIFDDPMEAGEHQFLFFESKLSLLEAAFVVEKFSERQEGLLKVVLGILHVSDCRSLNASQQHALLQTLFAQFEKASASNDKNSKHRWSTDIDSELCRNALLQLCKLQTDHLHAEVVSSCIDGQLTSLLKFIANSKDCIAMKRTLLGAFRPLVLSSKLDLKILFDNVFVPLLAASYDTKTLVDIIGVLNLLFCICSAGDQSFHVVQTSEDQRHFRCNECNQHTESDPLAKDLCVKTASKLLVSQGKSIDPVRHMRDVLRKIINTEEETVLLAWADFLPSALKHSFECMLVDDEVVSFWMSLFRSNSTKVCQQMTNHIPSIVQTLATKLTDEPERHDKCVHSLLEQLLLATKRCIMTKTNYSHQMVVVRMIVEFADAHYHATTKEGVTEARQMLFHCVRMMIFLLMHPESHVTHEASIAIAEMCARQDISPWKILSWYRHDIIKQMMGLAVSNYILAGITLHQSMNNVSHTFECRDPVDFVGKHYKIIMAMLLPWCLRVPKCDDLLREVAIIVRKDLVAMLSVSFLTIYTYLFISESVEITNNCIEYIMKLTGNSFFHLLHSDIKRTVSEVLIYYHINPECVMHAFRSLLSKDSDIDEVSTARIAEYIAERFLGVLANLEATLVNPDGEKFLKSLALLSLGDIIRLLGGEHITPFRFKIIAVLRTALALPEAPALTKLCVNTWRIFICTVDVRQLGSLLSTIFVTLEPLLLSFPENIGYIFRYLVIENNNLLGNNLGDLFFLEDTNVAHDIKAVVSSRIPKHDSKDGTDRFVLRLEELIRHCNHENLKIRAYALAYLCRLCETSRAEINEAILGQHQNMSLAPIATMVETLIRGLCEQDATLQERAAECLGELGALAPSHLPPNYAPTGLGFALSIHSDCFAIIALRELCRAYQRQKDSKFVDSFSLAIQEILNERGVSPAADKKREVWETIPERLRPIMEPLLTSCYTTVSRASLSMVHPVFNNIHSSHEWCYQWASQMIEGITCDSTRNLLRAFKPSLRCDRGTLLMMLPYVLLHALQLSSGTEPRNLIADELHTVFLAAIAHSESVPTISAMEDRNSVEDVAGSAAAVESIVCITPEQQDTSSKELALQCAKYAFGLFDFLERWKRQHLKENGAKSSANQHDYDVVDSFLRNFDCDLLAQVNFKCQEYSRALQYVECSLTGEDNKGRKLQDKLSFLSEIFSRLGDSDSVEGVMALKATEPTLHELILYHNATGRLQEAVACYERLLQLTNVEEQALSLDYVNSMIECYLRLDQPETALLLAESLLVRFHDTALHKPLLDIQAEPLYRLGRFEELEELIVQRQADQLSGAIDGEERHWGVICGSLIIAFRQSHYDKFCTEIERARLHVVQGSCSERISSRPLDEQLGTYESRYDQVLKLHIIHEFAKCGRIMQKLRSLQHGSDEERNTATTLYEDVQTLMVNLNDRLEVLQPNATTIEPIISLRRILLKEISRTIDTIRWQGSDNENGVKELRQLIDQTIGQLWMKSTELASRANMYQQALLYILHAESYRPPDLFIKNAKLLWDRRDVTGALKVLERGVNEILGDVAAGSMDANSLKAIPKDLRLIYAEGKRLIATYNAEASNISATLNRRYFKEALDANPESEIALVQLAQYIDKLYSSCPASEQNSANCWEMMFEVMKCYGKSMMFGSSYIYQSMPRVLSIWLDSTAKTMQKSEDASSSAAVMSRKIALSMNKLANKFKDTLSPYFFFTAFSQLISRVAHPSQDTFYVLKGIIVKLLLNYPQQTLWMMLSVYKSSYTNRVRRCVEIFNDRQLLQVEPMQKLIKDFNALAERLIELTNKDIPGPAKGMRSSNPVKITVSSLVSALPKLLADKNFSNVIIPIERCMQLVLNKNTGMNFQPYPTNAIYIAGIEEELTVLFSLQKPRKITLRGHNGKHYTMMLKPKDDLRKDFRLMEFNAVVKQYLAQDPDAKFRRLYIRTYAVLPLNEECGIIEWISNLNPFRSIVCTYYKQRGLGITVAELRKFSFERSDPLAKKRQAFESILVPRHPPLFGEWFRDCFPNPNNWFQARSSYIKTTAVISMVGYILGLGDRHGENILFDSTNGDTVHVDFNCLFNRGETFTIPELVPFRLTHNMVHAMGPLGVEGLYRRCCEIVLRILQTHASTFMSVLKPFVYDPMVSWSKVGNASLGQSESGNRDSYVERTDPQAMHNVLNIEERLKGYVKIKGKLSHMPLSIEGQVDHLIKEATDIDNLAQMYIGWSAYT